MFTELQVTSNFTFLTGASHAEEYMERAALLGLPAIAVADDNSVAGIVRAYTAAKTIRRQVAERQEWDIQHGLVGPPKPAHLPESSRALIFNCPRLIPAARLLFRDAPPITALPETRGGLGKPDAPDHNGAVAGREGRVRFELCGPVSAA